MVDKCISEGTFVDYTWKGGHLACTSLSSIKKITDKVWLDVQSGFTPQYLFNENNYVLVLAGQSVNCKCAVIFAYFQPSVKQHKKVTYIYTVI